MDFYLNQNSEILIRKIGLTLLHSLWLGIILALVAGLLLLLTKKTRPEIRYNLLTGLLCLFTIAVGFTFFLVGTPVVVTPATSNSPSYNLVAAQVLSLAPADHRTDFVVAISDFLARNAQIITIIWLLAIAMKGLRLGIGLYKLEYLKTHQVYKIGDDWEKKVTRFAVQMGISKSVKVLQSGLVKVPMVLGHFKPVILVPLGVVTSIPADQIEMVLLHELAHIKRLDFFVNFLQHLTELLFFFNPAVLWISSLIRKERENCCDDMALRYSGNKVIYINALLSFREYQLASPVYSVAFGSEGGLVQRAKRIASRTNSTLKLSEKIILALTVLMLFTFTFLFANNAIPKKTKQILTAAGKPALQRQTQAVTSEKNLPKLSRKSINTLEVNELNLESEADTLSRNNPVLQKLSGLLGPTQADTLKPLGKQKQNLGILDYLEYESFGPKYDSLIKKYDLQKPQLRQSLQAFQPYQPDWQSYRPQLKADSGLPTFNETILTEIEKSGIRISRNNIDYHITNNELIVNGVKVPDEIHQRVISAVLKSPEDRIDFTYGNHK